MQNNGRSMEQNDNNLEMGLFGTGNELELDLNFETTPEEIIEGEPAIEGEGTPPVEKSNPSDGGDPQETVAEEGVGIEEGKSEESSPNLYNSLAAVLKEQGLLSTSKENSITDVESFTSAFKEEIKQSEYADLSKSQRDYLDAVRDGVTTERFQEQREENINLEKITTEDIEGNAELRRRIIYQDLVNQGLTDESAIKYTNMSVENGTDVDEASKALPNIKEYNKLQYDKEVADLKKGAIDKQKRVEKEKKALKDAIMSPEDIFEGYKVTNNFKDAVYKDMNTVVGYNNDGSPENKLMQYRRENPVDFDAKLYYLFSLTNGFKNLTRFQDNGTSSAVSNLESILKGSQFAPSSGQPSFIEDPESYSSGFGDEIVM